MGGSGELAVAAEDTAGVLQFELQSQAAKFHAEFDRQARIAEEATERLRNEATLRTRNGGRAQTGDRPPQGDARVGAGRREG